MINTSTGLISDQNEVRNGTGQSDPLLVVCSSDEVPQVPVQATGRGVVELGSGIRRNSDPVYRDAVYGKWGRGAAREPPCPGGYRLGSDDLGDRLSVGGECIDYSDSSDFRFNDEPGQEELLHVQDTIFAQNRKARNLWERGARMRPYITLGYLDILTGRQATATEEAYSAEREELEGLAVAQCDSIDQPATVDFPLLNIVIANAGQQMKDVNVIVDMIGRLAAEDPKLVGVIGLDESRDNTAEALGRLDVIGLPVITSTLSADDLNRYSRLYFQLSAPNSETARNSSARTLCAS